MLHITNYNKAYGATPILAIPQLRLAKGIYWLKGENGAGKTTFMKSVAGLIPFDGEIAVSEISLRKKRMLYTKNVSFAEAEPVYPRFLTGNDLVRFYEETKGRNRKMTDAIIESFGMKDYLKNKTGTYSSGMFKKLSLLLSLVGNPQLVLLDEPFITLDVEAVIHLQNLIAASHRSDVSFLISSHQPLALNVPCQTLCMYQQTIQTEAHAIPAE